MKIWRGVCPGERSPRGRTNFDLRLCVSLMRSQLSHSTLLLICGSRRRHLLHFGFSSSTTTHLSWLPPTKETSPRTGARTHRITNKDVLRSLSDETHLPKIIRIFKEAAKQKGFKHDYPTYRLIINKLGRRKKFRAMELFLERMKSEGVACDSGVFNDLTGVYVEAGLPDRAVELLYRIRGFGCNCSERVFTRLLESLVHSGRLDSARALFVDAHRLGYDPKVRNSMVLLRAYCDKGSVDSTIELLDFMALKGCVPDLHCYGYLISWSCSFDRLDLALGILDQMKGRGREPDVVVYNMLINGFCRSGEIDRANEIISKMESAGIRPDTITFNTMMNGFCNAGLIRDSAKVLDLMFEHGVDPDAVTFTTLLNCLCKQEKVKEFRVAWGKMLVMGVAPDGPLLNILIAEFSERGMLNEVCFVLREMMVNDCVLNQNSYRIVADSLRECKELGGLLGRGFKRGCLPLTNYALGVWQKKATL